MSDQQNSLRPTWLPWLLCAALLVLHATLATRNWKSGFLIGHEFRQTQTAISARYIQQDDDFSLAYPTPVLGKPWSIPMEFPLYQWCTVWLSNTTGWSLTVAARTISLGCFYLTLPALLLLLRRLGCRPAEALIALAPVLTAPLYIFYSRSFLIESMALAGSVWFLASFVESLQRRHPGWLVIAMAAAVLAALVKVTTFLVWLAPAAVYSLWFLARMWRTSGSSNWRALLGTSAWMITAVTGACVAAIWWVHFADAVKALNPAATAFTSTNLAFFNFGSWNDRISPTVWGRLTSQWSQALVPWWCLASVVGATMLWARAALPMVLMGLLMVLSAQLAFPVLYSLHDYYYYATGVALLCSLGLGLVALLRNARLRWLGWGALVLVLGVQLHGYWQGYYQWQKVRSAGGSGLADALRNTTPPDSVLVVIGDDWSSILPYTAQRRALMIRAGLQEDEAYQTRAFADLAGEKVSALVVFTAKFNNAAMIKRAAAAFGLDEHVTFSYRDVDVYVAEDLRDHVLTHMGSNEHPFYNEVVMHGVPSPTTAAPAIDGVERTVTVEQARRYFSVMSPKPRRYRFNFPLNAWEENGRLLLGAHPDSELVFRVPEGARTIEIEFGIMEGAHTGVTGRTDGVQFTITEHHTDGSTVKLFDRLLDPANRPEDRGIQALTLPCQPASGSELRFTTGPGPHGNFSFDWAFWRKIEIR